MGYPTMMWMVTGPQDGLFHHQCSTFSFYFQNLPLPLKNYYTNVDFSYKIWWFFLNMWTLMHIFAKITLRKHVCIKIWLNINQYKSKMIHTCHMQILFFCTHSFFHPNMFIFACIHSHSNPTKLIPCTNPLS